MLKGKKIKLDMKKIILLILVFGIAIQSKGAAYGAVNTPYTTYTYDIWGDAVDSPAAFEFKAEYAGTDFKVSNFVNLADIFIDQNRNIYIVDKGSNRIVIIDENLKLKKEITGFINLGRLGKVETDEELVDKFNSPSAVYVTKDGFIYIADTDNNRIVVFNQDYHYVREIGAPESDIIDVNKAFKPVSIVLDNAGRIYVMSKNDESGILELSPNGEFVGYYGAQSVQKTVIDWVKELFQTKEQKARSAKILPRTYSSMAIDKKDFIWLTSNSLPMWDRYQYMTSKASEVATVKRLNPSGQDILSRNGEFAPGGDLLEVSSIVDVALKDNGIYSVLDNSMNKIFTYNSDGHLLYAFGGKGTQNGVLTLASALAYYKDDLIVLDSEDGMLVHYTRTKYGEILEQAIMADADRDFDLSIEYWAQVLGMNMNLDLAYDAMAAAYLRNGNYEKAMEYYKYTNNKEGYSKAYRLDRTEFVKKNFLLVIAVPTILIFIWIKLMGKVKIENKKLYAVGTKQTIKSELLYAFRAIYHPFDGFWEIKKEKRGSMKSATIILIGVIISFYYKAMGTSYLFRDYGLGRVDIIQEVINILIPFALWVFASWGLTTLMSGKGNLRDIYIMTSYAMFPLILINIPTTLLTNILALEEKEFITFFIMLGYVWMVMLIFFGSMVIHDYTFNKNFGTIILSIVGMAAMLFLAMLFVTLGSKIYDFFAGVYEEIALRL